MINYRTIITQEKYLNTVRRFAPMEMQDIEVRIISINARQNRWEPSRILCTEADRGCTGDDMKKKQDGTGKNIEFSYGQGFQSNYSVITKHNDLRFVKLAISSFK